VQAVLVLDKREIPLLTWDFSNLEPNKNQRGPRIQFALPSSQSDRFELHLRVAGNPEWNSVYTLAFKPKVGKKEFHGDRLNF
jgi:hypothetical protein